LRREVQIHMRGQKKNCLKIFIVEIINIQGRSSSGARSIENECGRVYNLTSGSILKYLFCVFIFFIVDLAQTKNLLTSLPTTVQEKCYVKCFGEETDLV